MNKQWAIVSIVVAGIVSALVAVGTTRFYFKRRLEVQQNVLDYQFECQPEISTALVCIPTLKQLRAEQLSSSSTIDYLESKLDHSVAGIGKYYERHPLVERDSFPATMAVLSNVKKYREQYPHTNQDAVMEKDIQHALSLVSEKPKH